MADLSGIDIDRYHIIEPLGQGGMAIVYKAYDTRLERDVAVKLIRRNAFSPDVLDKVLKRFDREAKSLAKLTHPNIVSIIDYGEHDGSPYLVMPYLPGGTLKQYLGNPMPFEKAAALLTPIADALAFAHQKGIIHRDVKPGNILITEGGQPMLTDFGIARLLETESGATITGTGVGVGTPEYMSPEQGMGREVDGRTDIYSLGVVLYELVTGRKPYTADTPMAVVLKQSTEPLPKPSSIVPGIPEKVDQVLFKALNKNVNERYENMNEFQKSIRSLGMETRQLSAVGASETSEKTADTLATSGIGAITYDTLATAEEPSIKSSQILDNSFGTIDHVVGDLATKLEPEPPVIPLVKSPPQMPTPEKESIEKKDQVIGDLGTRFEPEPSILSVDKNAPPRIVQPISSINLESKKIIPTRKKSKVALFVVLGIIAFVILIIILSGGIYKPADIQPQMSSPTQVIVASEPTTVQNTVSPTEYYFHPSELIQPVNIDRVALLAGWDDRIAVDSMVFNPTSEFIIASKGGDLITYVLENYTQNPPIEESFQSTVVAVSPTGQYIAVGAEDGSIYLWDTSSGSQYLTITDASQNKVRALAFSPDLVTFVAGYNNGAIRQWRIEDGKIIQFFNGPQNSISSIAFSQVGTLLAAGSDDHNVYLWDWSSGVLKYRLEGHTDSVTSVSFSPDGSVIASGSTDHSVEAWLVSSGQQKYDMALSSNGISSIAYSVDGTTLAVGDEYGSIVLWEVDSWTPLQTLVGHTGSISTLQFSPDGLWLASGSLAGSICLWGVQ